MSAGAICAPLSSQAGPERTDSTSTALLTASSVNPA